jgi:hypothetical protein
MSDTVDTLYNKDRTRRVRIEYDQDSSGLDPREEDGGLVEIVTPDLRRHSIRTEDALFQSEHDALYDRGLGGAFARYLRIFHDVEAVPVYMYDHSGIALSTGSFIGRAQHARWDSGMVGWAYVRPDAEKWEGMDEEKVISSWVETFGQWINGEVYGWVSENLVTGSKVYDDEGHEDEAFAEWDEDESCWGYIGFDYACQAAREELHEDGGPSMEEGAKGE